MKKWYGMKLKYLRKQTGVLEDSVTQAKDRMTTKKIYIFFIIISTLAALSCNRKTIPTAVNRTEPKAYDTTQYRLALAEAIKLKMLGNFGEATRYFEKAARINPGSDASYFEISQIAMSRGDINNAKKYAQKAIGLDSSNIWYLNNAASLYYLEQNYDSTEYYYLKMLNIFPEREDIEFNIGGLYLKRGKMAEAEKVFEKFYEKYGNDPQIIVPLISIKRGLSKHGEAVELLEKLIIADPGKIDYVGMLAELYRDSGEKEKAVIIYGQLLERAPNNGLMLLSYINFLISEKEYEKIKQSLQILVLNDSIRKDDKVTLLASILQDEETVDIIKDDLLEAVKALNEKDPGDATVTLMLADFYGRNGKMDNQQSLLREYIEINEDNYFIWEKLLLAYNDSGKIDELYSLAKEASSKFNRFPLPKLLYAFAATDKGEYELAMNELGKVRILVNDDEVYIVQILSLEADILYRQEKYNEAFKKFDKALEINPDDEIILNNYAYFLAEKNIELKKAKEMIEKCLELRRNETYLDTYAWVLFKLKRYRDAERIMEEVFGTGNISDPELVEHYGYIKASRDSCDEAVELWQLALKMDRGKSHLVEEIKKCLANKE